MAAENEIYQLIDADQIDNQTIQTYIAIQKSKGIDERMAFMGLYNTIAKSLEKRGKKKEAEVYRGYMRTM